MVIKFWRKDTKKSYSQQKKLSDYPPYGIFKVVSVKVCRQPAYLLFFIPAVPIATLGNPKALFLYDKTNSIV